MEFSPTSLGVIMKLFLSLFFVLGSLALIGLLDSAQIKKPVQKKEVETLTVEVPKRPPFNDEGPGCIRGVTCPNKRSMT